jgi:nitrous oxidase accessory protein
MGLGVKESGNLRVEDNRFIGDNQGLYLDTSPFREGDSVWVSGNTFAGNGAAVTFHSSETRNSFTNNVFEFNRTQVAVEGRGNARGVRWLGNYFDDYRGYDLNEDGTGDVPYELRSLSARLVADHPAMQLFRGTIALQLVDVAAEVFPLLQPETMLVDPRPRMARPGWATLTERGN